MRAVLGASGLAAAAFALLPAAIALLFALLDAGAHAFLGLSGALLAIAAGLLPGGGVGGGGLPPYRSFAVALPSVLVGSALRAACPALMVAVACRRPTPAGSVVGAAASLGAVVSAGAATGAVLAIPGLLAALVLLFRDAAT